MNGHGITQRPLTRRQRQARHRKAVAAVADRFSITPDDVETVLLALPYSSIPTAEDVGDVLEVLQELGWRPSEPSP